jgi:hypothetical protein
MLDTVFSTHLIRNNLTIFLVTRERGEACNVSEERSSSSLSDIPKE